MHYKLKAFVQNTVTAFPEQLSYPFYYWLQRHFGTLRCMDPTLHLQKSANLVRHIRLAGCSLEGSTCLEIGVGRTFNVALGLWLCGADRLIAVDLNPYLREELVLEAIDYIKNHEDHLQILFKDDYENTIFKNRLNSIITHTDSLDKVIEVMNLEYISPADSTKLELQDNSIDIHYSCDVFEHGPPPVLKDILLEAKRVLRSGGVVAHHIDLSDHFALSDPRIGNLNFLKFSEEAWKRLAGNRYMYQNRMRKPEFETLFHETDLSILYQETETDPAALAVLDQPLFERFASYSEAELAVTALDIVGHFPASITASATLAKFVADSKRLKTKGPRYGGAATIVPGGRKWPTR
jgi:hypothetical protein